jgi:hypothetical protein
MGDDNDQKDNAVTTFSVTRRTAWWALTVFSAICVAAHFTAVSDNKDAGVDPSRADKWTGSVMIISMALSFIACLAHHFFAESFVDKVGEGFFSVLVLALWGAGMAAVMNPDNGQAVTEFGEILNANLYFFSWASLATAVWIFCSFVTIQAYFKRGDDAAAPPDMTKWYLLVAASFVVMTSSIRLYQADANFCNDGGSSNYCSRVKYALSLGAVAVFFGLVDVVLTNLGKMTVYPEAGLTFTLFVLYIVGIAIITFGGNRGPGTNVGNLYFSIWLGFILPMFLVSKSWNAAKDKWKGRAAAEEEGAAEGDVKAEEGEASGDDKKAEDAPPEAPVEVGSS